MFPGSRMLSQIRERGSACSRWTSGYAILAWSGLEKIPGGNAVREDSFSTRVEAQTRSLKWAPRDPPKASPQATPPTGPASHTPGVPEILECHFQSV